MHFARMILVSGGTDDSPEGAEERQMTDPTPEQARNAADIDLGSKLYRLQCFFRDLPVTGDADMARTFRAAVASMSPKDRSDLTIAARVLDSVMSPREDDGTVYVVTTLEYDFADVPVVKDCEVLDAMPRWDWKALGQEVRVANVNGGDSAYVDMPAENRGR